MHKTRKQTTLILETSLVLDEVNCFHLQPENVSAISPFFLFLFCADVDECQSSDACRSDHVCNNTIGSYTCECAPGFTKNPASQNNLEPVCNGEKITTQT